MDLLSIILAATMALGATAPSETIEARSHIVDLGATAASEPSPSDTTEARSHIIDLGQQ